MTGSVDDPRSWSARIGTGSDVVGSTIVMIRHGFLFRIGKGGKDEALHAEFAIEMYNLLENPLPTEMVHEVLTEAVALEEAFVREALPKRLEGINEQNMCQYVRFCADRLLSLLKGPGGLPYARLKHHKARTNPFPWMNAISLESKTNFFEKRVAEYVKANVGESKAETFDMDVDF